MSKFLYARFDVSDDASDAFHYACEISNLDDVEYVNVFRHEDEMDGATVNNMADLKSLPIGTLLVDVTNLPVVRVSETVIAAYCDLGAGLKWNHFDEEEVSHGKWFPMRVEGGLE